MRRGAKPPKARIEAKLPVAPKSRTNEGSRVSDLKKRLAEALKREAEALEQQAATSEILRVTSSSLNDLQTVMNTVAEYAARLCEASDTQIFRLEGQTFHLAASHGPFPPARPVPVTRGSVAGRAVIDRQTIHVRDIATEPDAEFPDSLAKGLWRTVLAEPLLRDGVPIGAIVIRRTEVRPFSDKQLALLKTFAAQAVIAIENIRLFNETNEALKRQTATSEILRVISGSPTDVQPVFETIVRTARRLCDASYSAVYRVDGNAVHLIAHNHQRPEAIEEIERAWPLPLTSTESVIAWAIREQTVVHMDVQADSRVPLAALRRARALELRSMLVIPMVREGQSIGAVRVSRTEPTPFSDAQIALLKVFADQAVIAIENVRLFNETKEALEQQRASSEILRVISSSPTDVQPVFDVIVQSAVRLCGGVHSNVYLVEDGLIHLVAHHNFSPAALEHLQRRFPMPVSQGEGLATRVIREGILVHLRDAQTDPEVPETTRRTTRALGARSVLYVPMLRDRVGIGVIVVSRGEVKPFSDKEIALIRTFADQAVIAIENVRLFNETKEALERQTATAEILGVISSSPTDIQPVLDAVAESAARLCAAHDAVILRLDGEVLRYAAHHGSIPRPPEFAFPAIRGTVAGRAVLDRQTIQVADLLAEPEEFPEGSTVARQLGYRTLLSVPLLREGVAIGAINLRRTEVQPFTDKQIALLRTFATQAVIAIENVRLFNETKEALERQTATAEILRAISKAQTDVQPVFEAIADSAIRLFGAWGALVFRYDGELISLAAARGGLPGSSEATMAQFQPQPPTESSLIGRTVLTRAVQHIIDIETDPSWGPGLRERARMRGWRSTVQVPMLSGDDVHGVIGVSRAEPGGFSPAEIALLMTFADQAVIAVKNARLLTELQARTAELTRSVGQLTALGDVGRTLSSTLDLDTILQTIVTRAGQLAGTDACSVFEYDEATEAFHLRATNNLDEEVVALARRTPTRKGEGVQGHMAVTRQPVQISDIAEEDAYRGPMRDILLRTGTRAVLAIPMLREDQLIGGLTVNKKTAGEFSPEVIELLKTFATQSALAIQNARLFRELADKSRQLEVASQHKSDFLANMSHELRTPLNAIIGFSEVLAEGMFGEVNEKQTEYLRDILESGQHLLSLINDILDLSKIEAGRMELELTDFDLPQAISNALTLVRERAGRRGIALRQAVDQRLGQIRGDERKIKQVLLNLLSNALKFTPEGGRVDVRAGVVDGMAEISVTDTGIGIASEDQEAVFEEFRQVGTAAKKVEGTGLGLALSRKFIELHGGRIWVKSHVGMGSTFTFTLPLSI